jgi:hypothetical protein
LSISDAKPDTPTVIKRTGKTAQMLLPQTKETPQRAFLIQFYFAETTLT